MSHTIPLTFLGTGNAYARERDWSSFLIDGRILVEPAPTVLPNLRRVSVDPAAIEAVFVSHFHADHTFGWPFLLLEYVYVTRRTSDLWVAGPRGVEARLTEMVKLGAYPNNNPSRTGFHLRWVEVDEGEQMAGDVRFRAVRVEHAPDLDCYGFLIEYGGRTIGYSGDTRLCDGLRRIAAAADVLVLECNQGHGRIPIHMNLDDVRALRQEFPDVPFILTHVNPDVTDDDLPRTRVAADFETIEV